MSRLTLWGMFRGILLVVLYLATLMVFFWAFMLVPLLTFLALVAFVAWLGSRPSRSSTRAVGLIPPLKGVE